MPSQLQHRSRTALVLSAGGVFGAYQAGVWKALHGCLAPDLVVGASIGAVNGYLIASGCPPAELEQLWLESDGLMALRPKVPRHWSHGFFDGSALRARVEELCRHYRPRTEFGVVVTEMRRLRPRCLTGPRVGAGQILASCAVLGAFDLQRLDGAWCTDGGLLGPLPWWVAVELGATRIVAVNVLPRMPLPIRGVVGAIRRASRFKPPPPDSVEQVTIAPVAPLGPGWELLRYRKWRVREWLDRGYEDGLRMKHSIEECFERE